MSELWGFQSGQQQADETNLKMQMGQLALNEGAVDTQQKEVNLKTSQLVLDQQAQLLKRMQSMGSGGSAKDAGASQVDGIADQMYQIAQAQFASGLYEAGSATADKAGRLQVNQSKVAEAQATQQHKMWSDIANSLQGVTDSESLHKAFQAFSLSHPEEASLPKTQQLMMQLQQGQYNQKAVDAIRNTAITQKDQAATAASAARAKASEASAKRDEAQVPLEKARTDEAIARTAALRKAGGDVALPKASDVNYVMQHVMTDFDVSLGDDQKAKARLEATQVAADAAEIRAGKPSLSVKQSLDQAYAARKSGGNFAGLKPVDKSIGGSAAQSLPLPPNLSKLQENRWYVAPDSKGNMVPQLWDGSSFNTQESLTADEARGDDGDDSDDEPAQ